MSDTRVCTLCVLCLRQDYGYSNWTVEGTELSCLAGLNPALDGNDDPWREPSPELAAALDVAETCGKFRKGAPATMDVDAEGFDDGKPVTPSVVIAAGYTDDPEAAEFIALKNGWTGYRAEPTHD